MQKVKNITPMDSSRPPASPLAEQGAKRPLGFGFQGADATATPGTNTLQSDPAVLKTLQKYFGFGVFRSGQQEIIEAALAGRDTAVFWATGSGKSICYQLPALHLGRTVVVVSPLISLMVDQVTKFNATAGASGGPRACLLGSAQVDPKVEGDAARGLYQLVYVTPEKLASSFLDRLKILHAEGGLGLLAVDEAHCISEWGHDFRPAYRQIKNVRQVIPGLPIMTLTATAVPRVQNDIIQQLGMTNPEVSLNSFDRPNLKLTCTRKQSKAVDLARIAQACAEGGSTIVYVPTQAETDSVAQYLSERLQATGVTVSSYHGGKYGPDREAAHMDFLSGKAQVIVATVAFGMGIDKPDIRRIVHFGPPKTVEEYYQQVGRAGRDGLAASCELISSESDFSNYASDFYTKGLTPEAKDLQLKSTTALRGFAVACDCRRRWLLEYFGEKPAFGERCGTCDTCETSAANVGDLERDFRGPAAVVFEALAATEDFPLPISKLLPIMTGAHKSTNPTWAPERRKIQAMEHIKRIKEGFKPFMRQEAFIKEMLSTLCSAGYVERQQRSATNNEGYTNNFEVYVRSTKGKLSTGGGVEIRLPVPQAIRQQEEKEKRAIESKKQELIKGGVDIKKIPLKELERGEGKTIDAQLTWTRRLAHFRTNGAEEKATKYEEILTRIFAWRDGVAQKLRMAPGAVLGDTLALNIAYSQPTSVEALNQAGVRIVGVEDLAELMKASTQELFRKESSDSLPAGGLLMAVNGDSGSTGVNAVSNAAMLFPDGCWQAPMKWEKAIYKAAKNGALPVWEVSYNRWVKGEHPQAIAMNQTNGKAIQVTTIFGHMMTALSHAKPVHLRLLAEQCENPAPREDEWRRMEEAAAVRNVNVDADDYKGKDVLAGILGPENVNMEPVAKTEEQKTQEMHWYKLIRWWEALRRIRFPVQFSASGEDAKRQKVA